MKIILKKEVFKKEKFYFKKRVPLSTSQKKMLIKKLQKIFVLEKITFNIV